jgi:hypothetical protein
VCYNIFVHFYVYSIEDFVYLTTLCDKYKAITIAKYLLSSILQAYEKRNNCLNCYRSMKGNKNYLAHHS